MLLPRLSLANIRPRAEAALRRNRVRELRGLRIEQCNGALVICGVVSSFYIKQLAQETVWALCKDIKVELRNQVCVHQETEIILDEN